MDRQFSFGRRIDGSRSAYLLCLINNKILSVKEDEPIASLYDQGGNILQTKNFYNDVFKSHSLFKKQEQEKDPNKKKKYILFQSITGFENKIYLLFTDREREEPHCNRVVEITYENNDFSITNVYQLRDDWYYTICRVGNKFICYSATNEEFQIFEL